MRNSVQNSNLTPTALALDAKNFDKIRNFLRTDIPSNLFMISWLENYGVCTPGRRELFEWVGIASEHLNSIPAEQLSAVALLINKRLLMLSGTTTSDLNILAAHFERYQHPIDHIVAKSCDVIPFWNAYAHRCPTPRLTREQKYLFLRPDAFENHSDPKCGLRLADEGDLDAIFFASAAMHVEESLENPLDSDPIMFRRHVQRRIQTERTYVWIDKIGRLIFKADVSAQCSFGTQISGIYVPPSMRRRGFARRAIKQLCTHLFSLGAPLLTLYVNCENLPARALYEDVGFGEHCDFYSVFVV